MKDNEKRTTWLSQTFNHQTIRLPNLVSSALINDKSVSLNIYGSGNHKKLSRVKRHDLSHGSTKINPTKIVVLSPTCDVSKGIKRNRNQPEIRKISERNSHATLVKVKKISSSFTRFQSSVVLVSECHPIFKKPIRVNKFLNVLKMKLKTITVTTMKNLKSSLFLALFLMINFLAFGQHLTQTVKGKITDIDTQVPITGAYVILMGSEPLMGSVTDFDGNFRIDNVPIGRQSFKISFVGYEEVYLNEITVTSGQEVIINIPLRESIQKMDEIVIRPDEIQSEPINNMVSVSSQRMTVESTSRIAAGINDPGRTVQSYAGVSAVDDENNEIVVRGNSPRGMLWRMEGIEIPNPNHFSNGEGGSGGAVSALSTQVLDDSDFLTGAFPAEYGNATSSVFDLKLRTGNFEKREYAFQAGILGIQAALEGPFSKNSEASYLVNYRYSTTAILNNLGVSIGDSDISPEWQDLSYNFNFPTKKAGRFNIWGLGGISQAANLPLMDTAQWQYRNDAYGDTEKHIIGITGISHNYLLKNQKTYIKTVAAVSYTDNRTQVDSVNYELEPFTTHKGSFAYGTLTVSSLLNHKFNAKNTIRTGVIYSYQGFDLFAKEFDYDQHYLEPKINSQGNTGRLQSYAQWKWRVTPSLDVNTGLHYTHLLLNGDHSLEPRMGATLMLNPAHSLHMGVGLHSTSETASIYLAEQHLPDGTITRPNEMLGMTRAWHNVIGYSWNFAKDWSLKAEAYYQYLYNVPVIEDDTTGTGSALNFTSGFTNDKLINEGTGENYGIEFTIEKFFSSNYYLLATASLFESKYTMPDQIERNTVFNSKYMYNLVGGKEFSVGREKQNVIGVNFRMIWRGGYRTIPVDFAASEIAGRDIRQYDAAYETKAPDYFRLDVGVNYRRNHPKWSWILSLDLQNATNHLNVWDEYYHAESASMQQALMNGLVPILNYKIEF